MSETPTPRREAWPDLEATTALTLPSGYTLHVRQELEAEAYYVLADIVVEIANLQGDASRKARTTRRALNRELCLTWVTGWDIRPRGAAPSAAPMPVSDEALQMLDRTIAQEIDDAVGTHQAPFIAEIVQIFTGAPTGKATADPAATGGSSSSASASAPTSRPTPSRAGRRGGTR